MPDRAAACRAAFLDRDGTITRDRGYTHRVEDLELLPRAAEGLRRMAAAGYRLIIVTNQSGIGRGMFTTEDTEAFHRALHERLHSEGVTLDAVYYCPFHPEADLEAFRQDSPLRKPNDGMLRLAAAEHHLDLRASVVVGDKNSDILAGRRAGCRTILVQTGCAGSDHLTLSAPPDFVASDLLAAAQWLEQNPSPPRAAPTRAPQ